MSKRIRINDRFYRNTTKGENDIYRKFSEQFDNLFNSEEMAQNDDDFNAVYVNDTEFETDVERFRSSKRNMVQFCVGYAGIGKSTCLRHIFSLGVSNQCILNHERKELVFPTFLDGYLARDIKHFDLATRLSAVCAKLETEYPTLKHLLKTDAGKRELFDFISCHTGFALENVNPVDAMDMSEHELIIAKLKGAYEKNPYEFQANKLKFYITKLYDKIERLVILLDDIESLPEKAQREIICKYLKLYSCMKNTDYPTESLYCINLLISVRPHTYRILKNRNLETFSISELPILKSKSVNLDLIFEKRFRHYTKKSVRTIGNINTWNDCYEELMKMNHMFDGQYMEMINNLCFMNVRESISSYARVFANRFWVQRNKAKEEYFTISSPEYAFNNINVIRALACNEEEVFWGTEESIVPNIFFTTETEDLSMHCLFVMQYFAKKKGSEAYGVNAETLENIKNEWNEILGERTTSKFTRALEYLFIKRVLRKSIEDIDDVETLDTKASLKDNSKLYLSPRGDELFHMLLRDSVLLEMLRESAWRIYESRKYSKQSSSELMRQGNQPEIFMDLLEYIDYLCELEDDIVCELTRTSYRRLFGEESPVNRLLVGVKRSLDYSGLIYNENLSKKYMEVSEKVNSVVR